jgi:hypothetical protein
MNQDISDKMKRNMILRGRFLMIYKEMVIFVIIAAAVVVTGGHLYGSTDQTAYSQAHQRQEDDHGAENKGKAGTAVNISGDVHERFTTIEQLKDSSELIAKVEIEKSDSFPYKHVVFTLSEAKLLHVYKGEVQNDETIKILETGGYKDGTEYTFEGNKVFTEKETAIVFLEKYEGPIVDHAYVIKGGYQGKFVTDGHTVKPANGVQKGLQVKTMEELDLE